MSRKSIFRAAWLVPVCVFLFVFTLEAQSRTNVVIYQMIDALGGQAFLDVKDIHTSGRFFGFTRGELSASDLFNDYIKFPDMERTEFGGTKNKSITINRGNDG